MTEIHPPVCHIVPPHVLERIAREHQDPRVREVVTRTLALDRSMRRRRVQIAESLAGAQAGAPAAMPSGPPPAAPAAAASAPGGQPSRTVYDAQNGEDPSAAQAVRTEGDAPVQDAAVNDVYDHFGASYDFWWQVFQRDSIDAQAMGLHGIVHFGQDYDNAFWDGQEMIFGDGDGQTLTNFTGCLEVIGHELTHGVTQHTCNLTYQGQSGALNESISDVFGCLVKQHRLGQSADQADWLIGVGVLGPAFEPGKALRSLAAPGTAFKYDQQPATMSAYVDTDQDYGGVHINSGIPSHAFYLAAMAIGGNAWERAGRIWYQTMLDPSLSQDAQFQDFAAVTVSVAQRLFGDGAEAQAVRAGWDQVGVQV
jgi:Zn-dependent metalloprotease